MIQDETEKLYYDLRVNQKLSLKKMSEVIGIHESEVCRKIKKYPWYIARNGCLFKGLSDKRCQHIFPDGRRCSKRIPKGHRFLCAICFKEGDE